MAKALIKIDSRSRMTFFKALQSQQERRRDYGELSFTLASDDHQRHICYVILEWESFKSLDNFLDSILSREIFDEWPVEKILEISRLREIDENFEV